MKSASLPFLLLAACHRPAPSAADAAPPPVVSVAEPVVVDASAPPVAATSLPTDLKAPADLAIGRDGVYLVDGTYGLSRFADGRLTPLKKSDAMEERGGPIALDTDRVYWAIRNSDSGVWSAKHDGTDAKQLEKWMAYDLLVDADSVYVLKMTEMSTAGNGTLVQVPKAGGAEKELATIPTPLHSSLAQDETHIYWIEFDDTHPAKGGSIKAVPKAGGKPKTLVSKIEAPTGRLALDEYEGFVFTIHNELFKVPKTGGKPMSMVTNGEGCLQITAVQFSRDFLYYACDSNQPGISGSINRIARHMGGMRGGTKLSDASSPAGLAVDNEWVYWTEEKGQLRRVKKP